MCTFEHLHTIQEKEGEREKGEREEEMSGERREGERERGRKGRKGGRERKQTCPVRPLATAKS